MDIPLKKIIVVGILIILFPIVIRIICLLEIKLLKTNRIITALSADKDASKLTLARKVLPFFILAVLLGIIFSFNYGCDYTCRQELADWLKK